MDVLPKEKKEWPYREKQSENGNVVFFTVLYLDSTNHSYFFINFIKHITCILFWKKKYLFQITDFYTYKWEDKRCKKLQVKQNIHNSTTCTGPIQF